MAETEIESEAEKMRKACVKEALLFVCCVDCDHRECARAREIAAAIRRINRDTL